MPKPLHILGVNNGHNASACLIRDGELLAACEQERMNREKYTAAFPQEAIDACLREGGIDWRGVDIVAFPWVRRDFLAKRVFYHTIRYYPRTCRWFAVVSENVLPNYFAATWRMRRAGFRGQFRMVNHHDAHAASAFFVSPFERSAVLSVDGAGEYNCSVFYHGQGHRLTRLQAIDLPHSVGGLYEVISVYLGFDLLEGPGKVMGLAAFGQPTYAEVFRQFVTCLPEGRYAIDCDTLNLIGVSGEHFTPKLRSLLGPPRREGEPLTQRHKDIAASLQEIAEELMLHMARHLHATTGERRLCLAGGVALNSVANDRLLRETPFQEVYIQAGTHDAGTALGAAYAVYHQQLGYPRRFVMTHAYWGPRYSAQEIETCLRDRPVRWERLSPAAVPQRVAEALATGKVVGWFQDRMEFGPRALGNRSILADPRRATVKEELNAKVKYREEFRPFAPAVTREACADYFSPAYDSPFMLLVADTRSDKQQMVPAIVHVDGTARLQTVDRETNQRFWELIKAFEQRTGVPVLLNTSFNVHEPIVCSPEDAVRTFEESRIDLLVLGDYLVERNGHAVEPSRLASSRRTVRRGLLERALRSGYFRVVAPALYYTLFLILALGYHAYRRVRRLA
ncbi:MAG: carbamoyltransferase [Candidatus Omnitrophica bacterium]|nr:carbamoyltransferase [Candidatus Omnitrophota bacterium]